MNKRLRTHASPLHFAADERGGTAVEFTLAIPAFLLLTIGTIGLSMAMYATSAIHFATEDAARYASVNVITTSGAVDTYGKSKYKGPPLSGLAFTLNPSGVANCGTSSNVVTASGSFVVRTGLKNITVPLAAKACYPAR